MAGETLLLKLYKKLSGDKSDTFNVTTMLNDNWDKIDAHAQAVDAAITSQASTVASLSSQVSAGAKMVDVTTGTKYKWGIDGGKIYVEEVS